MFFTLEQEHLGSNCPRCGLTDTFLSTFSNARYCVNCHQLYDRTDEARLREQKMDEALWTVQTENIPGLSINTHQRKRDFAFIK